VHHRDPADLYILHLADTGKWTLWTVRQETAVYGMHGEEEYGYGKVGLSLFYNVGKLISGDVRRAIYLVLTGDHQHRASLFRNGASYMGLTHGTLESSFIEMMFWRAHCIGLVYHNIECPHSCFIHRHAIVS
jgi:hypothetical protein